VSGSADLSISVGLEAHLYHSPESTVFADIRVNGNRETWPVRSKGFCRWIGKRYFEATRGAPKCRCPRG
jgi:hypothetical protein